MKITLLKSLLVFGTFLCFGLTQAQEVTGTVSDANGPLPGASVVVKGTVTGTQTDFDGNYTIEAGSDATLVFSYVGFKTAEAAVDGQSSINVTLAEDAQALEEVVVVGYGSTTRKEITTAVTSVSEEDFNQGVISEASQLLQGKVAGLSVYNRGGDPNTNATVRLRGISTIGGNAEPLVVIDGVLGQSLDNVDPSDIANITVLKDGSAAAIYGTRGSAGVILVTTKSGKSGDFKVTYNGQFSTASIARSPAIMGRAEFLETGGADLGADTDWVSEVTRAAFTQVHNVAASGGSDKANYRVSLNFRDSEGILVNSGFQQFNARTKLSGKMLNDKLKIDFNSALTQRNKDIGFEDALRYAQVYNPTAPVLAENAPFPFNGPQYGGYFETLGLFDSFNPVSIANQNEWTGIVNTLNYSIDLKYAFTDNLSAQMNYGQQHIKETEEQYFATTSLFRGGAASPLRKGQANFLSRNEVTTTFEAFGTYSTPVSDKFSLKVIAGYSYQDSDNDKNQFGLGGFPDGTDFDFSDGIQYSKDLLNAGFITAQSERNEDDRIIAFFGRANATIDNAIYLNASIRREGSSRFGSENQWGLFPSAAIGVDLNKYLQLSNVDLFKVRLGYGVTGAQPIREGLSQITYGLNDARTGTANPDFNANPDLKWEEKQELNLGIEFNTGRFGAVLDIYNRDVVDFISLQAEPADAGLPAAFTWKNAGELNTKGVELSLNYDVINSDKISYNTGLILSTNRTVLEDNNGQADQVIANLGAPGQNGTPVIKVAEGERIGQIWGPRFSGEVDASGSPIMVDLNGDGEIIADQGNALAENGDFEELGNGLPTLEVGWTNQITIGKWDVNAFWRGAFGHSLVNNFRVFYEPRVGSQSSYNFGNSELARNDIKTAQFSSYYVEKADFVKLDNLAIGYTIDVPADYLKSIRISLAGQNLWTITNYTGVDPEPALQDFGNVANGAVRTLTGNALAPGIDRRYNYFSSTTFTLGVNINF